MSDWISEVLTVQEQLRNETVFDDPMQRLLQEHRIIAALTSSLEVWSISAEEDDDIDVECADLLMSLLAEFVDEVHHKKEETIVVPMLVELDLIPEQEHLRVEHQHERYLVDELRRLTGRRDVRDRSCCSRFATLARELAAFQRGHLESETRGIYAQLDRLDSEQRETLDQELRAFDRRKESLLKSWRTRLQRLLDRRGGALEDARLDVA